ncbi:hypothetical protein BB934_31375 (plasmid) [Microvirga ossetica]|uniref:YbhG-like alpha-helical hairpin domain-containing protein n=1 Tax=Microvirga ossetica TaxID=1882682 RepID=A0A1B2ESE9_9HYPH|nr:HlyD family efflux transporter periplasmic adaptor subunit [Microvirga ossetica]ANY82752.1 hypothetical protein BB934_31375 [Microvirga ossetica]
MSPRARLPLKSALVAAVALGSLAPLAAHAQGTKPGAASPGLVRKTEIRMAPEINGRLALVAVRPGQHVHKGDVLAVVDNPELAASVEEAKAAAAAAKAERDHVYAGVRAEEVAIAAEAIRTAEANLLLAQQESARATALSTRGYSSGQQLDEIQATLAKAQADLDLKQAQFAAANAGPTAEERSLADARVALASATIDDLQAKLDKTTLRAPLDAMVRVLVAEPGEVLSPGKPIMTIEADGQPWFTFTLREDALGGLTMGGRVSLQTSLGHPIEAQVTELRPLGEFATWRAARAVGDHDLNSFLVRLEPSTGSDDLEPGMTIWLPNDHN